MKRGRKLLVLAMFVVAVFSFAPADVQAHYYKPDRLRVIIDDAYYTDYDNDGKEDDIVTNFRIYVDWYDDYKVWVDVSCEITTPSQTSFQFEFEERTHNGFEARLVWLNTANEHGWYGLCVGAEILWNYDFDTHAFDPPGGGNPEELPSITIDSIEQF